MYKKELALNNLQWSICQTKPNSVEITLHNGQFLKYPIYTQYDLLWIKSSSRLLSRSVSSTDSLIIVFNIIIKDLLMITSYKLV